MTNDQLPISEAKQTLISEIKAAQGNHLKFANVKNLGKTCVLVRDGGRFIWPIHGSN